MKREIEGSQRYKAGEAGTRGSMRRNKEGKKRGRERRREKKKQKQN